MSVFLSITACIKAVRPSSSSRFTSDFDFLHEVATGLEVLSLDETKSKRPRLDALPRFRRLKDLFVAGHTKDLHRVADLPSVEILRFSRLSSPNLSFLGSMRRLWWLAFLLGGSTDLSAIADATGLKYLEISWVRGLADISLVSKCTKLQRLVIDRLKQVRQLPDFRQLKNLRALSLSTLRNLESVDPIKEAPALEWFGYGDASNLQPEDFRLALQAPSLKRATVGFGSDKRNGRFEEIAAEQRISSKVEYEEFEFR